MNLTAMSFEQISRASKKSNVNMASKEDCSAMVFLFGDVALSGDQKTALAIGISMATAPGAHRHYKRAHRRIIY